MTTLQPPIQAWFTSLDWNLSYCNRARVFGPDLRIDFLDESESKFTRGPLIKSTSLKSTKESNAKEPQRRKSVRFADALGLNLENVRVIHGGQPKIPASAYSDLKVESDINGIQKEFKQRVASQLPPWTAAYQPPTSKPTLVPEFVQPSTLIDFLDRVRSQKVCLQNCMVTNEQQNMSTTCIVRVANISYLKKVFVRFTIDNWRTFEDVEGEYSLNSSDGWSDRFICKFTIKSESSSGIPLIPGQRVQFAIRYLAEGSEHWDNNGGANYSLIYHL